MCSQTCITNFEIKMFMSSIFLALSLRRTVHVLWYFIFLALSLRTTIHVQSSQRNTLHPCAHELHMGCTTGELALSDELHPSLKP